MGILSKAKNKSEWSDELIAYMVDGDIRIDEDVHQEFGMLESREYGWLLRMPSPTPRYEWVAYSDDYPTKKGHSYCVALEPDPVDQMPEFMNWLTIVIVLAASQGTTKDQERAAQMTAWTRMVVGATMCILLLAVFIFIPFLRVPPEDSNAPPPEAVYNATIDYPDSETPISGFVVWI